MTCRLRSIPTGPSPSSSPHRVVRLMLSGALMLSFVALAACAGSGAHRSGQDSVYHSGGGGGRSEGGHSSGVSR